MDPLDLTEGKAADAAELETTQSTDDGGVSLGGGAASAAADGEIVIGNERFPNKAALVKAHEELRKGFTQNSQKYAEDRKQMDWLVTRIRTLRESSPEQFEVFKQLLNGGASPKAALRKSEEIAGDVKSDPRIDELSNENRQFKAQMEIDRFQRKHSDLDEDGVKKVVNYVLQAELEGRLLSLEDGYTLMSHSDTVARAVSEGQKKAEAAAAKGAGTESLASGATASQSKTKGKDLFKMKSHNEQNAYIGKLLDKHGAKFSD